MVYSYDAGSLPFNGDLETFLIGATNLDSNAKEYFEKKVMGGFLDKLKVGVNIPNYPQYRDMNEMFLKQINGIKKTKTGYMFTGNIHVKSEKTKIQEVDVLKRRSNEIYEKTNEPFKLKVCITGPYTLSSLFLYKDATMFKLMGNIICKIVESNIFTNKYGKVELITIDEPLLGSFDDPQLDYGAEGREILLESLESIFQKAKSRNTQTSIHLHSTSNQIFWELKKLDVIESHVDGLLYKSKRTKKLLEDTDKFLKASTGITNFDKLIRTKLLNTIKADKTTVDQEIGNVWEEIRLGKMNPILFLESAEKMKDRLNKIVNQFTKERVLYAGLECGLKSFPTYRLAIEYLKRSSESTSLFQKNI